MRRFLLTSLIFACTCATIVAQHSRVRNFPVSDYDAGLQTWSITQGSSNHILFGNNEALLVFNGANWEKYYVPNYSPVRAVFNDERTKRVYVGASDEMGYFYIDGKTFQVRYTSLTDRLPKEHKSFGEIWNIFNRGNDIIFQSKSAIFVMNNDKDMLKAYSVHVDYAAYIHGKVVVAGRESIGILRTSGGITPLEGTEPLRGKTIRAILPYHQQILFVTSEDGVFAYDGKTTTPMILPVTPYLTENHVFCAAINNDDIAFGTVRGGLVICNAKNGEHDYPNVATGMQDNAVLSVAFDKDKNVWVGLSNGISYALKESSYKNIFGNASKIGTGYAASIFNGQLYLGTNQGLFHTAYPVPHVPIPPQPQLVPGMTGQVWTLDNVNGTLFCGSDRGAYIIRGTAAEQIKDVNGTWKFVALSDNRMLACDYQGLLILERMGNTYVLRNRINNFDVVSGSILVDDDGTVWVCHWQKGVYHLWLNDDQTSVARQEHFHKDKGLLMDEGNVLTRIGGRIYISCVDGLYRYDRVTHSLVLDDEKSNIFHEYGVALNIFETPGHNLWAFKTKYLAHAIYKNGKYELDKQSFVKAGMEMNLGMGNMCFPGDRNIICCGNNGFFYLNSGFKDQSTTKPTFIRRITSTNNGDTVIYTNGVIANKAPTVRIPHKLNSLRIDYVQPEFRTDNAILYSCRLEGYDKEWSSELTTTSKEYTHLGKGRYTFRVKARNMISGKADEASIVIVILPAWYETWWAYIIYLLMTGAAIYYGIQYIRKRTEQEKSRIKTEKERQLREQKAQFDLEQSEKERELMQLKNEQMAFDVKHKSSELADSTMNLVRKNDLLQIIDENVQELCDSVRKDEPKNKIIRRINDIRHDIQANLNDDANWDKFEENFNLVYDNFMQKLLAQFPDLKKNDRKLCAYLRMGLSSKEMASLLNTSVRSIETARYRLRKKLDLDNRANLTEFIQSFDKGENHEL